MRHRHRVFNEKKSLLIQVDFILWISIHGLRLSRGLSEVVAINLENDRSKLLHPISSSRLDATRRAMISLSSSILAGNLMKSQ